MLYTPEHLDAARPAGLDRAATGTPVRPKAASAPRSVATVDRTTSTRCSPRGAFERGIAPMDKTLVASVREMLVRLPAGVPRLQPPQAPRADRRRPAAVHGGGRRRPAERPKVFVRASGEPLTQRHSRPVHQGRLQEGLPDLGRPHRQAAGRAEEAWVLWHRPRHRQEAPWLRGQDELVDRVRRLYLEEYIKVWDAYLADVQAW